MSKEIAPRLYKGARVLNYGRLPSPIKEGLKAIARKENKSVSWVVEQVIIDYFGFAPPRYKEKRNAKKETYS